MTTLAEKLAKLPPEKRALLEQRLAAAQQAPAPSIGRLESIERLPSFGQERLWFLEQYEGGTPLYNISLALRLRGPLDVNALTAALQEIVARHETLRTAYLARDGKLALEILDDVVLPLPLVELDSTGPAEREDELRMRLRVEAARVISLADGMLVRCVLYRLGEDDHSLQVTMHHIASDGWSLRVFLDELSASYNARRSGAASPLRALPLRYSDYAHWERTLGSPELDRDVDFWAQALAGAPYTQQLPLDRPRPAKQTFDGAQLSFVLLPEVRQALVGFCASEGVTPFMALVAAWFATLHRYTGQSDLLIGSPVANRTHVEVEPLIGFFTTNMVLRARIEDGTTFRSLLKQVRSASLEGFAHQSAPFERIIEALKPDRDLSRPPLFQTMFILQTAGALSAQLDGLDVGISEVHSGTAKFDVTISARDGDDGLVADLDYNTDLFDEGTARRIWKSFVTLLSAGIGSPDRKISDLPVVALDEREVVISQWNATERSYPAAPLASLVEARAAKSPQRPAVVFETETLTYAELDRRANALAADLVRCDVGPNVLVGICLERSVELVVALLAVHKSGGAYVPLDPGFPRDRLAMMAADAGIGVLITERDVDLPDLPADARIMFVSEALAEHAGVESVRDRATTDDLAYVLYTSGSTGRPKGVEITRGAFLNFLHAMQERPGIGVEDVLVAVTTVSFDIAGLELFLPLLVGGQVVIASREAAANGEALRRLLADSGATLLQATPTTWRLLLAAGWEGSTRFKALCGGEAMPPELVPELTSRCESVWNMYGPTETTVWSTVHRVTPGESTILIGRPIANTTTYVLDAHRQPVPIGVTGELYIGGAGVARGYRNRPELTAEKFLDDPFRPGARMYRTGDLARFHADGNLECLGRTDHQVKIRGFRIELGEIEAALLAQPGIAQAVVIAREDVPGDRRLVAYVVASGEVPLPDAATLRSALKATLPDYMLPSAIVALEAMPLTANGKVDRKALPAPDASAHFTRPASRRPRTYTEGLLRDIWSELFGGRELGTGDDFFELGGHSLLAVQLMNRIKQVFGKQLPLNAVFESPTIESLAKHIEDDRNRLGLHSLVPVRATGSRPPIFWIPGGAALGLFTLRGVLTRLSSDQPVYGLGSMAPKSIDDVETVEQRAANYLELIRRQQPQGPYFLAGFCAGGRVAYEIAQQLTRAGETVAFVGLINCTVPRFPATRQQKLRFKAQRLRHQLAEARRNGITPVGYLRGKLRDRAAARAERERRNVSRREVHERGLDGGVVEHNQVLLDATVEKFEWYDPQPYSGRVTLFISLEDEELAGVADALDPRLQWGRLAASVEVQRFPGGHLAIVEMPRAEAFALAMQTALDNALRLAQTHSRSSAS